METILRLDHVKKTFYKDNVPQVAVDIESLAVKRGSCLGIVGESGCGKSTTAKLMTRLLDADEGTIWFDGADITKARGRACRQIYRKMQMVFQTPQDSFDPRRTIGDGILEGMCNAGMKRKQATERLPELLAMVELPEEIATRYPGQVSGGQCQRAAIARALAVDPKLLICDEATSALDVTVQLQIIRLLQRLGNEQDLSLIVICHDLALVQELCDEVAVMQDGRIVEWGTTEEVINNPKQEYTKQLIEAV